MPALLDDYRQYVPPATGFTSGTTYGGLDLEKYLANDPVLRAQLLGITGNTASQLAGYDEARRAALINYGEIPQGYDVDATTRAAAEAATRGGYSTTAQNALAFLRRNQASVGNLGARGIVRSGAFGANAIESQRLNNIARAKALSDLEAARTGFSQQALQAQSEGIGQRVTAEQNALDRLYEMIKLGIIADPRKTGAGGAGAGAAAPMKPYPQVQGYNPAAYVPGGSSPQVGQAITNRALQGPLNATYNPRAYVSSGAAPRVQQTIQSQGQNPSPYRAGLPAIDQYRLTPHGRSLV